MNAMQTRRARLRDWAELVRVPNTPTVAADVAAGAVLVVGGSATSEPIERIVAAVATAILAAVALYWAGMIYNDLCDLAADRSAGRPRPLVQQRVSFRAARTAAMALFGLGIVAALLGGAVASGGRQWAPTLAVGGTLAALIYLYDGPLKTWPIAPALMGGCRTGSFLLGALTALVASTPDPRFLGESTWGLPLVVWGFAISMGVYVAGLTTFARREAAGRRTAHLTIGLAVMIAGVLGLALSPRLAGELPRWRIETAVVFPAAIALVCGGTLIKAVAAIRSPSPASIGPNDRLGHHRDHPDRRGDRDDGRRSGPGGGDRGVDVAGAGVAARVCTDVMGGEGTMGPMRRTGPVGLTRLIGPIRRVGPIAVGRSTNRLAPRSPRPAVGGPGFLRRATRRPGTASRAAARLPAPGRATPWLTHPRPTPLL